MPSSDIKTTRRIYFPADRHRIRRLIDELAINSIFIFICYRSLWFLLIDPSSLFELVINNSGDVHEMFAGWVLDILFTSPFKAPFLCILIIRKGYGLHAMNLRIFILCDVFIGVQGAGIWNGKCDILDGLVWRFQQIEYINWWIQITLFNIKALLLLWILLNVKCIIFLDLSGLNWNIIYLDTSKQCVVIFYYSIILFFFLSMVYLSKYLER